MNQTIDFVEDEIYGERLLISIRADQTELEDNIRVARVLLNCFDDMFIRINEHLLTIGHKNPEYTINGKLGDRKGVESENGIKSAFRKAKIQGCKNYSNWLWRYRWRNHRNACKNGCWRTGFS